MESFSLVAPSRAGAAPTGGKPVADDVDVPDRLAGTPEDFQTVFAGHLPASDGKAQGPELHGHNRRRDAGHRVFNEIEATENDDSPDTGLTDPSVTFPTAPLPIQLDRSRNETATSIRTAVTSIPSQSESQTPAPIGSTVESPDLVPLSSPSIDRAGKTEGTGTMQVGSLGSVPYVASADANEVSDPAPASVPNTPNAPASSGVRPPDAGADKLLLKATVPVRGGEQIVGVHVMNDSPTPQTAGHEPSPTHRTGSDTHPGQLGSPGTVEAAWMARSPSAEMLQLQAVRHMMRDPADKHVRAASDQMVETPRRFEGETPARDSASQMARTDHPARVSFADIGTIRNDVAEPSEHASETSARDFVLRATAEVPAKTIVPAPSEATGVQDSALPPADAISIALSEEAAAVSTATDAPTSPRAEHRAALVFQTLPQGLGQRLAETIAQLPDRPVEVTLSPEELGRVRMSLSTHDGTLTMSVTADRPETLDLLRRNIDQLAQDFRELGFRDLSFSFGDRPARQSPEFMQDESAKEAVFETPPDRHTARQPEPAPNGMAGGLDLRL